MEREHIKEALTDGYAAGEPHLSQGRTVVWFLSIRGLVCLLLYLPVCVSARAFVCAHVCLYVVCIRLASCLCVYLSACVHLCLYSFLPAVIFAYMHVGLCLLAYRFVCICISVCMYMCDYVS